MIDAAGLPSSDADEPQVRGGNAYQRALWVLGAVLVLLAAAAFVTAQTFFGPSGFAFDSTSVPITYYLAGVGSTASGPLLMSGLVCFALAMSVGALNSHATALAATREHPLTLAQPEVAARRPLVEETPAVPEPPRPLDPRVFMRPAPHDDSR